MLWVAALLASLLSLPRLFAADHADGTLEQIALSPHPLPALVLRQDRRALADDRPAASRCWRRCSACSSRSTATRSRCSTLALLLGTPILSLLGAVGAALTLGVRGGGSLLALLVLPLYVPVLIFGAGAVDAVRAGARRAAHLSLLGAGLLLRARRRAVRRRGGACASRSTDFRIHGADQLVPIRLARNVLSARRAG